MKFKNLIITTSVLLLFLAIPQIARAQEDGEAQYVSFDADNCPTLKFTNKSLKEQGCGSSVSLRVIDNNEEAVVVKVSHLHLTKLGMRGTLPETGWLYITATRIIFTVEFGDQSHGFDVPRAALKDKPASKLSRLRSGYVGIEISFKEKLPASNSSGQKFVFFLFQRKGCHEVDPDPYRKFIERAVNDFPGAIAEFKQTAETLKQSWKYQAVPAVMLPPERLRPKVP
jgi:hypothetical protein